MSDTNTELVRFYRQHESYNPGDTAGFKPRKAHAIVAARLAVYVNPPPGCSEQGITDEVHAKDVDPDYYDPKDPIFAPPADENFPAW